MQIWSRKDITEELFDQLLNELLPGPAEYRERIKKIASPCIERDLLREYAEHLRTMVRQGNPRRRVQSLTEFTAKLARDKQYLFNSFVRSAIKEAEAIDAASEKKVPEKQESRSREVTGAQAPNALRKIRVVMHDNPQTLIAGTQLALFVFMFGLWLNGVISSQDVANLRAILSYGP